MQFIIDNQAWFLLIAGVTLLAVIGKISEVRSEIKKKLDEEEAKETESTGEEESEEDAEIAMSEELIAPADDGLTDSGEDLTIPLEEIEAPVEEPTEMVIEETLVEDPVVETEMPAEEPARVTEDNGFDFKLPKPLPTESSFAAEVDEFGLNELPTLRTGQDSITEEKSVDDGVWEFK